MAVFHLNFINDHGDLDGLKTSGSLAKMSSLRRLQSWHLILSHLLVAGGGSATACAPCKVIHAVTLGIARVGVCRARLKFADSHVFFGQIEVYRAVPCVWFGLVFSFAVVIPIVLFINMWDQEDHHDWDVLQKVFIQWLMCLPTGIIAGYVASKMFLNAISASFFQWMCEDMETSVILRNEFEQETGGLFNKVADVTRSATVFQMSIEQLAGVQRSRTLEMWFVAKCDTNVGEGLKELLNNGKWHQAAKMATEARKDEKLQERIDYFGRQLIKVVHITNTQSDISNRVAIPEDWKKHHEGNAHLGHFLGGGDANGV